MGLRASASSGEVTEETKACSPSPKIGAYPRTVYTLEPTITIALKTMSGPTGGSEGVAAAKVATSAGYA